MNRHDKGVDVTETITEKQIDSIINTVKWKAAEDFEEENVVVEQEKVCLKPSINLWSRHQVLVHKKLCRHMLQNVFIMPRLSCFK